MAQTKTIDLLYSLEEKVGKEESRRIVEAFVEGLDAIEAKSEALALQKKLELKDELTKELVTKAEFYGETRLIRQEMQTVRQEMQTVRQEMQTIKAELDRKFTVMFVILFFTIVFLNQNALEFLAKVLGLIK